MLFLEPEVDYFRMQLHQLALPQEVCQLGSTKKSCSLGVSADAEPTPAMPALGKQNESSGAYVSVEEQADVLHRALLTALHQRFPYEHLDTLEHVYLLVITHLSSPPLPSTTLSCEELASLQGTQSFLPPELRFRTFPSHLNALLSSNTSSSGFAARKDGVEEPQGEGEKSGKKPADSLTDLHYNDTYFILLPELTREQQQLYCQRQSDTNRTSYRSTDLGGFLQSDTATSETCAWEHATPSIGEEFVRLGKDMTGFRVLDGTMIYNVAATQGTGSHTAPRSLQFAAFKVPLSRFTPEEQQYYTNKREEARFCGGVSPTLNNSPVFTLSTDNYMNDTMHEMLAFEMPDRYCTENDATMEKFFSKCNKILRCYTMLVGAGHTSENEEKETAAHTSTTPNVTETGASTSNSSSALVARRLVYSFAPCDCYHLVTDENNPLYYAKSSRAAYDARTVSITLVSDLTAAPWSSPTISVSSHANTGPTHEGAGGTSAGGGGVEGLVCSNQVSRAASPDPIAAAKKSGTRDGRSSSPQPAIPRRGNGSSEARAPLPQLFSKTDGFLTLTTSLSCNNVSGNPKHKKESLLEKGVLLCGKEQEQAKGTTASSEVSNTSEHTLGKSEVVNLFRLLSNSSAAQHQLRHGVIRPVVSMAVLDRERHTHLGLLRGDKSEGVTCHGLLDHTWYSIPVQPLPALQDDVQWMPIIFGSTECISDVGYRTAMQIGFFPNKSSATTRKRSTQQTKSGVVPTLQDARTSLTAGQGEKSALAPRYPNVLPTEQNIKGSTETASSSVANNTTHCENEDIHEGATARRGGVAMTFGNDEQPASVTARRGGMAMTFGNDEQPANVTARRAEWR
ncbi:hypothetical protein TraAM80_05056 [Trypanosoma rangeli]|uniref:Uncharacterized protein n=1 Tax=Trypanosoma rangeli TaxID=5698 RepID=A0A3R7KBH8_TRYRA|nr:uncharacterized protein TraAM80_05056 [Trypanosoma rangeli]RNF04855.1 hypothetical protein TraAM80_05056 [Trypanosoma rangeli]|eukprot:RNF04855.1 hypothetical protein TraAM80_05056 [Trypanosoma rangeli]